MGRAGPEAGTGLRGWIPPSPEKTPPRPPQSPPKEPASLLQPKFRRGGGAGGLSSDGPAETPGRAEADGTSESSAEGDPTLQ